MDGEKDCRIEEGREVCDDGPARVRSDCSGLIERVCFGIVLVGLVVMTLLPHVRKEEDMRKISQFHGECG